MFAVQERAIGAEGPAASTSDVLETAQLWLYTCTGRRRISRCRASPCTIDNAAAHLVGAPTAFDLIVTGNIFGDILSDESAMCCTARSACWALASLGRTKNGLFETVRCLVAGHCGQGHRQSARNESCRRRMMLRYSLEPPPSKPAGRECRQDSLKSVLRTGASVAPAVQRVGTRGWGTQS